VEFDHARNDFLQNWDTYGTEANSFETDVHTLILISLDAGITQLNTEAKADDDKLMRYLPTVTGEAAELLAEDQAHLWIELSHREIFLRNMALVALLSRLTHTLHNMLGYAETWAPRDPKGHEGGDEFKKIWSEFRIRFGINLGARYIGWVDRYRRARNLIVHNGGEANIMKPFPEMDMDAGAEGMYDVSFSKNYPAFVNGTDVVVTQKLLHHAVESAVRLVKHAAGELRELELEAAKKENQSQRGGFTPP
jgi:hypothetical protein